MKLKKLIAAITSVALVASIVALSGCSSPEPAEIENYNVEGDTLTVGILSDLQFSPEGGNPTYENAYRKALELLKAQDVDMILNVGDYTDTNTQEAADNVTRILNEVYPESERPISLSIMGNHDYWLPYFVDCWEIPFKGKMQRRAMEAMGETSPWTHKVVNGYHFIGFSPSTGDMDDSAYADKLDWAKEQIKIAVKDAPDKPVFVIIHAPPAGTVNSTAGTAWESGDEESDLLDELFSQYPQVVSISGHTHFSLLDDRSIWQGEYTAINTQSLSYTSMNGTAGEDPSAIEQNPMCMIMEISDDQLAINRYGVLTGERMGETWTIQLPIQDHLDTYTFARVEQYAAPVFPENATISAEFKTYDETVGRELVLRFPAAQHERYVYGYTLSMTDASGNAVQFQTGTDEDENPIYIDSVSYTADFYLGYENMAEEVALRLGEYTASVQDGTYTVSVTARDTWGHESAPIIAQITVSGENIATAPGV